MLAISGYQLRFILSANDAVSATRMSHATAPAPDTVKFGTPQVFVKLVPGEMVEERAMFEPVRLSDESTDCIVLRRGTLGSCVVLPPGMTDLSTLGTVEPGPAIRHWTIETDQYVCRWPAGVGLTPTRAGANWPFELYGPSGALIFVRGPRVGEQVPTPPDMIGAGQEVVGQDVAGDRMWLDLEYTFEGERWRQRHAWVGFPEETAILVTGQSPVDLFPGLASVVDTVAGSLRLNAPPPHESRQRPR